MVIRFLIVAIRIFVITFAFRYIGWNANDTLIVTFAIVFAMGIK